MDTLLNWLTHLDLLALLAAIAGTVFGLVKRHQAVQRWQLGRALACIEAGVREVYEGYTRAIKESRVDGKLTGAERAEAMRRALTLAQDYAKAEGLDLLRFYAKAYLPVVVERLLTRRKHPLPFDLLPEWEDTSRRAR